MGEQWQGNGKYAQCSGWYDEQITCWGEAWPDINPILGQEAVNENERVFMLRNYASNQITKSI